jgi:membrane-associated two-gene conflict system component 1 (EACC1)
MEHSLRYIIRFEGLEAGDAGQAAESLRRTLIDEAPGVDARRARTDDDSMDFGTTLVVVLAAPAVVELAKGIAAWLARTHSSKVTITRQDGTVVVENIGAREAVNLLERLQAADGS